MFYTVKKLAEYLDISTRSIYLMVQHREVPFYKIKKSVRFDKEEIDGWLKDKHFKPENT